MIGLAGTGGSGKMPGTPLADAGERRKVPGGSFAGHLSSPPAGTEVFAAQAQQLQELRSLSWI
jgi:hypothetical protein